MNIKQVGYFVAVFETKSFTAAAQQRNVTVQAISKSISELEQFFNVQFFERGSSGVRPTQAGRSFYAVGLWSARDAGTLDWPVRPRIR